MVVDPVGLSLNRELVDYFKEVIAFRAQFGDGDTLTRDKAA